MDPVSAIGLAGSIVEAVKVSVRILQIATKQRAEFDLVNLQPLINGIDTCTEELFRLQGNLLDQRMENQRVRILTYGYDALSFTWGDQATEKNRINEMADVFRRSLLDVRREKEERNRPLIFATHCTGGLLVQRLLAMDRSIFELTTNVLILGTGRSPMRFRRDEIPRLLNGGGIPRQNHILSRMMDPNQRVRALGEVCLPLGQIACVALMGGYKPVLRQKNCPSSKEDIERTVVDWIVKRVQEKSEMLWFCQELDIAFPKLSETLDLESTCGARLPTSIIRPSATTFVFSCMTYGILAATYYNFHRHHKYQQPILILGLILGATLSLYLLRQNTTLNVLTTILPTFLTTALIFSTAIHLVAGTRSYTEEKKIFQILNEWATNSVSTASEGKRDVEKEPTV